MLDKNIWDGFLSKQILISIPLLILRSKNIILLLGWSHRCVVCLEGLPVPGPRDDRLRLAACLAAEHRRFAFGKVDHLGLHDKLRFRCWD